MTDQSARQPNDWTKWSSDVSERLATLSERLRRLQDIVYGPTQDYKDGKPPAIVRIIQSVVLDLANERRFMRDAGIWSAERLYGPGSTVTKDGCAWVAQTENQGVKPGESDFWRLIQKSVDVELRKEVRSIVRDEVRRQLVEKRGSDR
jgi:hypothetical protein